MWYKTFTLSVGIVKTVNNRSHYLQKHLYGEAKLASVRLVYSFNDSNGSQVLQTNPDDICSLLFNLSDDTFI